MQYIVLLGSIWRLLLLADFISEVFTLPDQQDGTP